MLQALPLRCVLPGPPQSEDTTMKYMVEFRLKPGAKEAALQTFEQRGPNRNPGVTFRGAWVGTHSNVVFALLESESDASVTQSAEAWRQHGEFTIHPVLDIEQY